MIGFGGMNIENIEAYVDLWTTHQSEYVLSEGLFRGSIEYTIVHLPSRSFLIIENDTLSRMAIEAMLQAGNRIITLDELKNL